MEQQRIISQQLSSPTWAVFGPLSNIYKKTFQHICVKANLML